MVVEAHRLVELGFGWRNLTIDIELLIVNVVWNAHIVLARLVVFASAALQESLCLLLSLLLRTHLLQVLPLNLLALTCVRVSRLGHLGLGWCDSALQGSGCGALAEWAE